MDALLLQRPDDPLHHGVLLRQWAQLAYRCGRRNHADMAKDPTKMLARPSNDRAVRKDGQRAPCVGALEKPSTITSGATCPKSADWP